MAGQVLTSRVAHSNKQSWQNKALGAAQTVGHGLAVANGIREALPIISGAARSVAGYLPALAMAGAPLGF